MYPISTTPRFLLDDLIVFFNNLFKILRLYYWMMLQQIIVRILRKYALNSKVTHYIKNKQNSGILFANGRRALILQTGNIYWIAESDDFSNLDFLLKMIKEFDNHKDLGLVLLSDLIEQMKNLKTQEYINGERKLILIYGVKTYILKLVNISGNT